METSNQLFPWLELIDRPAFCVKNGVVVATNSAAERRMLYVGTDVREIVTEHREEYEEFNSGCLYLTVTIGGLPCTARINRTAECDIFLIHQEADDDQLQTLALAAQQLRIPLSNVMTVTDHLLSGLDEADENAQQQASQINHSLFQLLRIIGNMSDASSYKYGITSGMQTVNITAIIDELIENTQAVFSDIGITLSYSSLNNPVYGLAHEEKLRRAIYNLLSNAMKFSPAGSTVEVALNKSGNTISLTVCNTNIPSTDDTGFWNRYRREPSIEDNRFGLGLGMTLISAVASAHKGTVLVDHPTPEETRVTMTISIIKETSTIVSSPKLRIGDYAGGRDIGLLEFSEILPVDFYKKIN